MTRPLTDATRTVQTTLSLLTNETQLPDVLGNWTIASVIPTDVELQYVAEGDSVDIAKTLMHVCDFSQIPVLSGDCRQVRGSVTWKSLARFGNAGKTRARDVMEPGGIVAHIDDPLLDHIQSIVDDDYIFARDAAGLISYVVTTTDLAKSFYILAGPFMKLREIEKKLRHILDRNFTIDQIRESITAGHRDRIQTTHDLTFGHYVELIERPALWGEIALPFHRQTIVKHLSQVNQVRNRVMHFRPEPLTNQQELVLDWCLNWLNECNSMGY